jgi:Rrf2 family protein
MNANQQFSVSCHILAILAAYPGMPVTSETIATSVDTNPVVIRRIMSHLRQHGLVDSRPGANGGWHMTRPPSELSLGEVYHAIRHESVLAMHQHPNPDCLIGGNIQNTLGSIFDDAQTAMERALDKFTVANVLENTLQKNAQTVANHSQGLG